MGAVGHFLLQVGVEARHALLLPDKLLLGVLFGRDVEDVGHHVELLVEVKVAQAGFHGKLRAVLAQAHQVAAVRAHAAHLRLLIEGFAQQRVLAARGVGHQHFDALPEQLGRGVAKQLPGQLVGRHHVTGPVADDDADGGVGKHRLEAPPAVGQLALGLLQGAFLGDVHQEVGPALHLKIRQLQVAAQGLAGVAPDLGFHGLAAFLPGGLPAAPGRRGLATARRSRAGCAGSGRGR